MMICKKVIFRISILVMLGTATAHAAEHFHYLPEMETVELSPQIRPLPPSATIYTVPSNVLTEYLSNILLYDSQDDFETLPYIVGFDKGNNMGHVDQLTYTVGITPKNDIAEYSLLTPGTMLVNPDTLEELGVQAFVIGSAVVQEFGDVQTLKIKSTIAPAEINTRLTPLVGIDLPAIIDAKYPDKIMHGSILSIQQDSNMGGGVADTGVISLGRRDGIKLGNILDIVEKSREVTDPNTADPVELPSTKIGEVMVYNVKEKISLVIIIYSDRLILVKDLVEVMQQEI